MWMFDVSMCGSLISSSACTFVQLDNVLQAHAIYDTSSIRKLLVLRGDGMKLHIYLLQYVRVYF